MHPPTAPPVTVPLRDGLFRRNVRVARASRCLLQTGVFGSARRAHRIGAPAAEASAVASNGVLRYATPSARRSHMAPNGVPHLQ